jgi:hypothetical protein
MTKSWRKIVLYLISGEEPRPGMEDYWNQVFLAGMTPFKRKLLERLEILLVIVIVVCFKAATCIIKLLTLLSKIN